MTAVHNGARPGAKEGAERLGAGIAGVLVAGPQGTDKGAAPGGRDQHSTKCRIVIARAGAVPNLAPTVKRDGQTADP